MTTVPPSPAAPVPSVPVPSAPEAAGPASADDRRRRLADTVRAQIARGGRVESQNDFDAVVVSGHRVNHLLHFLIGVFTLGVWWLVWLGLALFGGETRTLVSVGEDGNVAVQRL
jgi:hypothetical protein